MGSVEYRTARPGEDDRLKTIWEQAFQEEPAYADLYFELLYRPENCVVACEDGKLYAAIHLMDAFRVFLPGKEPMSCVYLYALGTLPEQQGRGFGGETIRQAGFEGYRRGRDLVCFIPATPSLAGWYQRLLKIKPAFFCRRFTVMAGEHIPLEITRISVEEYAELREALLSGYPHATPSRKALELQELYCRMADGGFYRLIKGRETAIAAAGVENGRLNIKELLAPGGNAVSLVRGMLDHFRLTEACAKTPAFWHEEVGTVGEDCALIPGGAEISPALRAYWGLSIE